MKIPLTVVLVAAIMFSGLQLQLVYSTTSLFPGTDDYIELGRKLTILYQLDNVIHYHNHSIQF
jgi:hypothetical protein